MATLPVIYGPNGKPARVPSRRANIPYDAAGQGRRVRYWNPTSESVNAVVQSTGDVLRNRSRDMVRRSAPAATAIDRFAANIVGTGIVPVPKARNVSQRREIRDAWDVWVDECDADGRCDFYGLQDLVARQLFEAGECFVRYRYRKASNSLSGVPLQLQLLEPDFLVSWLNQNFPDGSKIRQGIEFDPLGRRVGYNLFTEHPGEIYRTTGWTWKRVPGDEILHIFAPLRPGQIRGLPKTASVLDKLYTLDQYDDAQLERQRISALLAFFFTKQADPGFGFQDNPDDPVGSPGSRIDSIEPGTGYELLPGEDVKFTTLPQVGDYIDYVRSQLRAVAGPLDLTYEQLTNDLTQVNYSSIRAGLLEIRRRHEQIQHGVIAFQLNRPIYMTWMREAVIAGALPIAPSAFAARPLAYSRAQWMPQGWQWVDPRKEVEATILEIRAGLTSRTRAVAERGYDVEELDQEIAEENARADELGLRFESDGRVTVKGDLLADPQKPGELEEEPAVPAQRRGPGRRNEQPPADDAAA